MAKPRRTGHLGNSDHVRVRADHLAGPAQDRPGPRLPVRLPAAPVLAPLAFIAANEIIYWTSWPTVQKLMLAIIVGYVVFGIYSALGRPIERPPLDPRSLAWILPWFAGLAVISYLGQYDGRKLIPEWVDLGVVTAFSLVICYLAVRLSLPAERVAAAVEVDELGSAVQPDLKTA